MDPRSEMESSTTASEHLFTDSTPLKVTAQAASGQYAHPDFLALLVRPVPYDYKLKRVRPRKTAHDSVVFEVDDSHRFRNSVSFAKNGHTTIHSLSGSRSSAVRELMKARARETEIASSYHKLIREDPEKDVENPVDVVDWERGVDSFIDDLEKGGQRMASPGIPSEDRAAVGRSTFRGISEAVSSGLGSLKIDEETARVIRKIESERNQDDDAWEDARGDIDGLGAGASQVALGKAPDSDAASWEEANKEPESRIAPRCPVGNNKEDGSELIRSYVNNLLSEGWEENVMYDDTSIIKKNLTLYVDDPNLIFEKVEEKKRGKGKRKSANERAPRNKYNIGNDKYYVSDGKKVSLGTFGVQHCALALRLDERFYRVNQSKDELKNFHRPILRLENGEYGMQVVENKKVTMAGKSSWELTLADGGDFHILEYAEDEPPFIVNPGMASLQNKYYRTSDAGDEPCPPGCIALEHGEPAPFFGFGDVRPGTVLQTIANNLFVAPTITHRTNGMFLAIVETDRIALRPFVAVQLVGQELPKEEVFAPHSRRLNQFCKDRLRVAAHRMFAHGKYLLMSDLDQMFPYFSEGSKRKWLKEYADCVKKGRDNVWVLRNAHSVLKEEDLRKLVTPEDICAYESMLACELQMQELGLRTTEDGEDNSGSFLPSWVATRNFVNAANGRGLLQLSSRTEDAGMPRSSCEDTFFSFRRVRFRKGNEAENRRILAEHQATYKERMERIWNRQLEYLSSAKAPERSPAVQAVVSVGSPKLEKDTNEPLVITRSYVENGQIVQRTEEIYSQKLIRAYLKAKKRAPVEKKGTLTCSNCGQSGHMKTNKSCPNYVSVARNSKKKHESERKRAKTVLQDLMNKLLSRFMEVPFSNAFHRPVSLKKFPNYAQIVKTPMDFSTIRANIRNFVYKNYDSYLADFKLVLDNCILYNGTAHSLTEIATSIYNQAVSYGVENSKIIKEAEEVVRADP